MELKASYTGRPNCWHGALRDDTGKVVWECEHNHLNRDVGSRSRGTPAMACARTELWYRRTLKNEWSIA